MESGRPQKLTSHKVSHGCESEPLKLNHDTRGTRKLHMHAFASLEPERQCLSFQSSSKSCDKQSRLVIALPTPGARQRGATCRSSRASSGQVQNLGQEKIGEPHTGGLSEFFPYRGCIHQNSPYRGLSRDKGGLSSG